MNNTVDKTTWTVYEPAVCECIAVKIGVSQISGITTKPVFMLELYDLKTERVAIKWLGVNKTPKGSYSVKENSDFAKLYRLTRGYVPKSRYSKAHQLLKHFIGCQFIVEFESSKTSKGVAYLKVTKIRPLNPIVTDGWLSDGRIRCKKWKPSGNGLEKRGKKAGNELEMEKGGTSHFYLASPSNSTPLKDLASKIERSKDLEFIPEMDNKEGSTMNSKERVFQYHQRENETQEQYYDRVIAESLL